MDAAEAGAEAVRRVAAASRLVARPLRLLGLLGAVAAFALVAALLRWLLHSPSAVLPLVALALFAFAGPTRLLWHAHLKIR